MAKRFNRSHIPKKLDPLLRRSPPNSSLIGLEQMRPCARPPNRLAFGPLPEMLRDMLETGFQIGSLLFTAIKFTEVMPAEHKLNPDPAYLTAAADAVERL